MAECPFSDLRDGFKKHRAGQVGRIGKRSLSALHLPAALCTVLACLLILGHGLYRYIITQSAKKVKQKIKRERAFAAHSLLVIKKTIRWLIFATFCFSQAFFLRRCQALPTPWRCNDRPQRGSYSRALRSARWQARSASKSGCPRGKFHLERG